MVCTHGYLSPFGGCTVPPALFVEINVPVSTFLGAEYGIPKAPRVDTGPLKPDIKTRL